MTRRVVELGWSAGINGPGVANVAFRFSGARVPTLSGVPCSSPSLWAAEDGDISEPAQPSGPLVYSVQVRPFALRQLFPTLHHLTSLLGIPPGEGGHRTGGGWITCAKTPGTRPNADLDIIADPKGADIAAREKVTSRSRSSRQVKPPKRRLQIRQRCETSLMASYTVIFKSEVNLGRGGVAVEQQGRCHDANSVGASSGPEPSFLLGSLITLQYEEDGPRKAAQCGNPCQRRASTVSCPYRPAE